MTSHIVTVNVTQVSCTEGLISLWDVVCVCVCTYAHVCLYMCVCVCMVNGVILLIIKRSYATILEFAN